MCILLLIIYYLIIILSLKQCDPGFSRILRAKWTMLVMSGVIILITTIFILSEKWIYFWDNGSYWYRAFQTDFGNMGVSDFCHYIIGSINQEDYNILPAVLIAMPLKVCGNSYAAFVILNAILFYIPDGIILTEVLFVAVERCGLAEINIRDAIVPVLAFSFSGFLVPVLAGYVDIICCPMLAMAFLLIIVGRDSKRLEWKKDLLLCVCSLSFLIMRRYFAYAAVGVTVFVLPYWLIDRELWVKKIDEKKSTKTKNKGRNAVRNGLKPLTIRLLDILISAGPAILIILICFPTLIQRYIFNNYVEAYSAYKSMSFAKEWLTLILYFGLLFFAFIIAALVLCVNRNYILITLSMAASLIITASLFFRTQDMGIQHYYVILPQVCILIYLGFAGATEKMKDHKKILGIAFLIIIVLNLCAQFGFCLGSGNPLFVSYTIQPKRRNDIEEIQSMDRCIEDIVKDGHYGLAYCTASSGILNSDLCNKAFAPAFPELYYVIASDVDLRDGFNPAFFQADIVVTATPVQTHLQNGQEIVTRLNELFYGDTDFRKRYEAVRSFSLDNGVEATVWVKKEPLSVDDIMSVKGIFTEIYPDHPELFSDRIDAYVDQYVS